MIIARTLLVLVVCLCFSPMPGSAQDLTRKIPLPDDVQLTPPADKFPEEVRAFAGKWAGSWAGKLDHVLVVEEIASRKKVTVVYAWGTAPDWNINKPGFVRVRGKIDSGTLEFTLRNGAVVTYTQISPDELRGEYDLKEIVRGTFKRVRE